MSSSKRRKSGDLIDDSGRVAAEARTQRSRRSRAAFKSANWTGSVEAALIILAGFISWLVFGWYVGYPRWWELTMTVGVPVVALLMLTVVEHTQSHANLAIHLKLDELIRASDTATNRMITVEDASAADLNRIHQEFVETAEIALPPSDGSEA